MDVHTAGGGAVSDNGQTSYVPSLSSACIADIHFWTYGDSFAILAFFLAFPEDVV